MALFISTYNTSLLFEWEETVACSTDITSLLVEKETEKERERERERERGGWAERERKGGRYVNNNSHVNVSKWPRTNSSTSFTPPVLPHPTTTRTAPSTNARTLPRFHFFPNNGRGTEESWRIVHKFEASAHTRDPQGLHGGFEAVRGI